MKFDKIGKYVSLSQGMVVNKSTADFFSDVKDEEHTYPLLRIVDFESGNHANYSKYVSNDVPQKVIIDETDILFTRVTCQCFRGFKGVFHNNLFKVDLISDELTEDYLYVVLKSEFVKEQAIRFVSSSVVPDLTHDLFKSIMIPIPDKETQRKIAEIILGIDKKIEVNNAICSELEEMAERIFGYWFLQYDYPDEKGKPYKSSGGQMIWDKALRKQIPQSWKTKRLSDFIYTSKNGDWGSEDPYDEDSIKVNCLRGADFPCFTYEVVMSAPTRFIKAKNEDRLLEDGDLVTEISGGSPTQATGRIGYINNLHSRDTTLGCHYENRRKC